MEEANIKSYLSQVKRISNFYEKLTTITGEGFNIFRTLNVTSLEVRMHSVFIAEFLNPAGTHGQGDLYLKLFIEQLAIRGFITADALVDVEKHIGSINSDLSSGGRIDILLSDKTKKRIIIENKIYAGDQANQLLRYRNYDQKAVLLYLNLYGNDPSENSTGGKLEKDDYRIISYKTDILQWLERCKKESASIPNVRETIGQYIDLIKYLTNQTMGNGMSKEIKKFIVENSEYIESIELCYKGLESIIKETKSKFGEVMRENFQTTIIKELDDAVIKVCWGEDGDGMWFGYRAYNKKDEPLPAVEFMKYTETLKSINNEFRFNKNWIGWFTPDPFKQGERFNDLDRKLLLGWYENETNIRLFVKGLIQQEAYVSKEFKDRI